MRVRTFVAVTVLTIGLVATLPLLSAEESAVPQVAQATVSVAAEGSDLFTPKPLFRIGRLQGPCTISVSCKNGTTISCHAQGSCLWRGDNPPTSTGFVNCDGVQTNCGLL